MDNATYMGKCEKVVQHDDKAVDQGKGMPLIFHQNNFCTVELSFSLFEFFIVLIISFRSIVMDLIPFDKVGVGAKILGIFDLCYSTLCLSHML